MVGKYSRLMDVRDVSLVGWVGEAAGKDVLFVVQEKVCGVNAWLGCDGRDVFWGVEASAGVGGGEMQKLERVLEEIVNRYRLKLFRLYAHIRLLFPDLRRVIVFGELFGGEYPHRLVPRCRAGRAVREGVHYAPDYGFYAFDIGINRQTDGVEKCSFSQGLECAEARGSHHHYLSQVVCNRLFESIGFFHARTLFQGRLKECLHYPNHFITHLPDWLNLPPIRNNWCEGTVIRPLKPLYTPTGERVLFKNINSRYMSSAPSGFQTDAHTPSAAPAPPSRAKPDTSPISLECADMLSELKTLFSQALLTRDLKHTGAALSKKEKSRLSRMLRRKVLDQFLQLNLNRFDALPARERQHITRMLCHLSDRLACDASQCENEK